MAPSTICKILLITAIVAFSPLPAMAEQKPLFELGLAAGGGYVPDYPAAGQNHVNGIVLPFPIYRGEFLRSDGKGLLRGRFIHGRDFELDVSLSGSLDADSDNNDARRGMPDLDHLAEFGPRLQWTIARAEKWAKIDLELPLRAVFSTDFSSVEHRGYLAEPQIAYQHENFLRFGLKLKLGLSAAFASEDLQDFFYQVDAPFVTATRPLFDAEAGYLGSRLRLSLLYPLGKHLRLFLIGDAESHHGAANEDSPLFREKLTYGAGIGLIWSFYQSERTVNE
jgi:outer membrane scaffolding protein for murein synthesis (MipA/OmpV family)